MNYISAYAIPGIKECDRNDLFGTEAKTAKIIEKVCTYYHVTESQLKSKSRKRTIALARHFSMYFIKKYIHLSLNDIGKIFGGRHHSTSINSISYINIQLSINVDTQIKTDYQNLIQII